MGRATLPPEAPKEAPACLRLLSPLRSDMCGLLHAALLAAFLLTQATSSQHSNSNLILTVDPQPGPHLPFQTHLHHPSSLTVQNACLSMVPGDTRPLLFLCKGNTLQSLTGPLLRILQSPTQSTPPCHASHDICLPQQDESRSPEHRLGLGRQPTPLGSCVVMGNSLSPSALIGRMGMIV